VAYGSTDPAVQEARDYLQEAGIKTDYLRLRSVPFSSTVHEFIRDHRVNYVVELNRDGQMHKLLSLDLPENVGKLVSVARVDGLPMTAAWIKGEVMDAEEK